jgi:hypothetical protein
MKRQHAQMKWISGSAMKTNGQMATEVSDQAFYTEKFEAHYQADHPEASELFKR